MKAFLAILISASTMGVSLNAQTSTDSTTKPNCDLQIYSMGTAESTPL